MNYKIISTGSQGNATVIENIILIDCGVPFKQLKEDYKRIKLVLLTHIHSDHFNKKTISKLSKIRPTLRFGCREWLVEELVNLGVNKKNIDVYDQEKEYEYDSFKIKSFELKHDVRNCGYELEINKKKYFYATDTNSLDNVKSLNCDMYFVEANYQDEEELEERRRKHIEKGEFYYEERVSQTHLSEVKAYDWLLKNMGENSEFIFMHKHIEKDRSK